ncbi:MAG TPA: polymer-forming cytoskeletal protein [Ardenticatenaceae bacterium]|nr:polymer-forming cytoskeletal protein [Ardenticatenaceae bacterium]
MNQSRSRFTLGLLLSLLLLLLAGSSVSAQEPGVQAGDKTVFGGTYVLEAGERLAGDLFVLGGTARVLEGASVDGNVAVMGGSATVAGSVRGNVVALGGHVRLDDSADVAGDLVTLGGNVDRAAGAHVRGAEAGSKGFKFGWAPPAPPLPPVAPGQPDVGGPVNFIVRLFVRVLQLALTTLAMGILGLIVGLFLPAQTRTVGATAGGAPAASAGIGCLTIAAVFAAALILAVIIIGIPVSILLVIGLVVAGLFGWIGLGFFVGDRLLRLADVRSPRPAAAAAIGTGLLTVANNLVGIIPCVGGIVFLVLLSWGLGAVVLSRGGTQRYPGGGISIDPDLPLIGPLDDEDLRPPPGPRPPRPAPGGAGAGGGGLRVSPEAWSMPPEPPVSA